MGGIALWGVPASLRAGKCSWGVLKLNIALLGTPSCKLRHDVIASFGVLTPGNTDYTGASCLCKEGMAYVR